MLVLRRDVQDGSQYITGRIDHHAQTIGVGRLGGGQFASR